MKFEDALKELRVGKKIRIKGWQKDNYILMAGTINVEYRDRSNFILRSEHLERDWEVYEEPVVEEKKDNQKLYNVGGLMLTKKQIVELHSKVKKERWCADEDFMDKTEMFMEDQIKKYKEKEDDWSLIEEFSQDVNNDYDTYDSAIVCAENEGEAVTIPPGGNAYLHPDDFGSLTLVVEEADVKKLQRKILDDVSDITIEVTEEIIKDPHLNSIVYDVTLKIEDAIRKKIIQRFGFDVTAKEETK